MHKTPATVFSVKLNSFLKPRQGQVGDFYKTIKSTLLFLLKKSKDTLLAFCAPLYYDERGKRRFDRSARFLAKSCRIMQAFSLG